MAEYKKIQNLQSKTTADTDYFINSLITRQLLIQEAQKEGIDQEEYFRLSLKNYYEQSLIKTLINRKMESISVDVTEDEIGKYLSLIGSTINLTEYRFNNKKEAVNGSYENGARLDLQFNNLSNELKYMVVITEEGSMTTPLKSGDFFIVYRVESITGPKTIPSQAPSNQEIKAILTKNKKTSAINTWTSLLESEASIQNFITKKD
ncbi:MAG: hypothetical protein KKA70_10415 [Proteobacteria bacterium]|nr:hypothetical protein [Pseudomonadota bacterium]